MSRAIRIPILTTLALALLFGGAIHLLGTAAHAQAFGRLTIEVKDEEGNPVQGVQVVATQEQLNRFRIEQTTNKKGKATFSFADATMVYNFHLEYEGYPPMDLQFKPELQGNVTHDVTLQKGERQVRPEESGGTVYYTPAERVFNEGVEALQGGDMATAKEKFFAALEKDPKMAMAHSAMAGVYLEEKNYEAALASVDRLMEIEPDNTRGLRMRYEAYKALGQDDEADAALEALSKLDQGGDTLAMLYNEGVQAARVGDLKAARARFQEVLGLDPNFVHALNGLAFVYMHEKKYGEAAATAEKILGLEPQNPKALQVRYDAYRALGDAAKTEEALQALAAVNPQALIEQFFNKGVELFNNGESAAAVDQFEAVLQLDPEYALAHYRLGVAEVSAGDMAGAKTHLEKFLELAPDHPEAPAARDMLSYLE